MPEGSGKALWEKVYNEAVAAGDSKEKAAKKAWGALKNAGYHKNESGQWVKGSEYAHFSMAIIKASFDKENQVMRWRSVNSDTEPDLYNEAMSPELFKDFVDRIENNTDVPDPFNSLVCEDEWCGGMPYLSIAHYKSGKAKRNVPGEVESIYVDGNRLKSTGFLYNNSLGKRVFDSLNKDLYAKKSDGTPEIPEDRRVRISIGFLDLEHKHMLDEDTEVVVSREELGLGTICPLCEEGMGRKIYTKGQLVHLALTRVPVNPRTLMEVDKSMDIITKKDDAKSIIGEDLIDELEEKSLASDVLVIKGDGKDTQAWASECYDPNTDSYDQECVDSLMMGNMPSMRQEMKSDTESVDKARVTKSESWGDEPASSYLVVGDPQKSSTWHLPVKKHGKLDRGLMGAAKAALTSNHRGNSYSGPDKSKALAKLKSLYRSQGLDWEEKSDTNLEATMSEKDTTAVEDVKETAPIEEAAPVAKADTKAEEKDEKKKDDEESESMKALTAKFSPITQKIEELRSSGVTGKDAEAALQPLLNELGSEISKALTPQSSNPETSDILKVLQEQTNLLSELSRRMSVVEGMAKASPADAEKKSGVKIPVSRSIKPDATKPQGEVKQLSQIQKMARRSVGLPVE